MVWEPETNTEDQNKQRTIHVSSLWIGLGIGIVFLFFGFWKTIGFLIFFGLGYIISHTSIRENVLLPIWNGWLAKWGGQRKKR